MTQPSCEMTARIRLGVAVRVLGRPGLRARDGRRAEHAPHLSVSLLHVREVLLYLAERRIGCYRLADDLAPYLDRPDIPAFGGQIEACADLLAETGALARAQAIRLTMHLGMHIALAAPDEALARRAAAAIVARARLLDALGAGPEAVLVLHIGGAHGDAAAALHRFAARFERLPQHARARVAVEHDEDCFSLADLLRLHQMVGVPVVFDVLHHQLNNPQRIPARTALALALVTWPRGVRPKIHVSTQRTEAHLLEARAGQERHVLAPRHGQHADYINAFEFAAFVEGARGLPPFDAMLEAKAADLALLRLREDLRRFAPEISGSVY
ncbi:MAG TPA: UV damage endonuclease UvsE [Roseiflexaceae bacterium]|nr:UV damage endonuclease UvsE [Roseiflexaceae bacterium]